MESTSASLLDRLHDRSDSASWRRLVELYTPLIRRWICRYSVSSVDADDLAQEVLLTVVRELPAFRHNGRPGAFRAWLRTITANRLRALWRSRQHRPAAKGGSEFMSMLEQLRDPKSGLSRRWDEEHDRHVAESLFKLVEQNFEPSTWRAFWRVVKDGEKPAAVAAELNVSVNAVLLAKSRVLRRMRQEMHGLVNGG